MLDMKHLDTRSEDFWQQLERLLAWETVSSDAVNQTVRDIILDVRHRGDAALVEYSRRLDAREVTGVDALGLAPDRLEDAYVQRRWHAGRFNGRRAHDELLEPMPA